MAGVDASPNQYAKDNTSTEFQDWLSDRRFSHTQFSISQLAVAVRDKHLRVTVIIPGKEVASTVAGVITKTVGPLIEAKIVASVVVVDAASVDGTGKVAAAHGARVVQRADIAPEFGRSRGKGDALWRGLLATEGDIVAFLDGDTADPSPAHLIGILGPLLLFDEIQMVRACFDRPFKSANGEIRPHEGGRVTEILARPLLNMYWPSLAGFRQPLAGEFAARRSLLETLSFPVGYGIEIGTLVDTYNIFGLAGLAEVDVGQRQNAHKPLRELTTMAKAILSTAEKRLDRGKLSTGRMFLPWQNDYCEVDNTERPPLQTYRRSNPVSPSPCSKVDPSYPSPPFVVVEGVRMFRDVGGYRTAFDQTVRPGLVYRSGEPSKMTQQGKEAFVKLGIRKIFDFRSPIEVHFEHTVHGNAEILYRKDSATEMESDGCALAQEDPFSQLLTKGSIERVEVAVFRDEDWLPEKRETRLKQYADAAQVGLNENWRSHFSVADVISGIRPSIPAYASQWNACISAHL